MLQSEQSEKVLLSDGARRIENVVTIAADEEIGFGFCVLAVPAMDVFVGVVVVAGRMLALAKPKADWWGELARRAQPKSAALPGQAAPALREQCSAKELVQLFHRR